MSYLQTVATMLQDENGNGVMKIFLQDSLKFSVRLLFFFAIIFIGSLIVKRVARYLDNLSLKKIDLASKQFTNSIIKIGLYSIVFVIALLAFGFSETSIATMLSAIGLGVGISLKEFLSNLAGGIVIFFTKPYTIGNFIKVNGVMGEVCAIEIFSTSINSLDSRRIIIPNNVMISGNLINFDSNESRRIKLMLSVSYDSDMKKVMEVLNNIPGTFEGLEKNRENFINVMQYGDSSINILFMVWTGTKGYYKVRGELMIYILEVFNREGIDVPYNIMDVNLTETASPSLEADTTVASEKKSEKQEDAGKEKISGEN